MCGMKTFHRYQNTKRVTTGYPSLDALPNGNEVHEIHVSTYNEIE